MFTHISSLLRSALFVTMLFTVTFINVQAQAPLPSFIKTMDYNDFDEHFTCSTTDSAGNIYTAGYVVRSSTEHDILVVKYTREGKRIEQDTLDPGTVDQPSSIIFQYGRVIVYGKSKSGSINRFFTQQWSGANFPSRILKSIDNPNGENCVGIKITKGESNNIAYGVGIRNAGNSNAELCIYKYVWSGASLTTSQVTIAHSSIADSAIDVVSTIVSNEAILFVTGWYGNSVNRFWTIKINGTTLSNLSGFIEYIDAQKSRPVRILLDDVSNYVYIAGWEGNYNSENYPSGDTTLLLVYDGSLNLLDTKKHYVINGGISDMAINKSDKSVALVGSNDPLGAKTAHIIYYKKNQSTTLWDEQWVRDLNTDGNNNWNGSSVVIDDNSNIYVGIQEYWDNSQTYDATKNIELVMYNSSGTKQWDLEFDGPLNHRDSLWGMSVDANGYLNVYGNTKTSLYGSNPYDALIIGYSLGGTFVPQSANKSVQQNRNNSTELSPYSLNQNYPNPFNPSTAIKFTLKEKDNVTLKVYNDIGQEIKVLLNNQEFDTGEHEMKFDASNLPSGVYFYRLTIGNNKFVETKKMVFSK